MQNIHCDTETLPIVIIFQPISSLPLDTLDKFENSLSMIFDKLIGQI